MKISGKSKVYDYNRQGYLVDLTPKMKVSVFKEELKQGVKYSGKRNGKFVALVGTDGNLKKVADLSEQDKYYRTGYVDASAQSPQPKKPKRKIDPKKLTPKQRELYNAKQKIEKKIKKEKDKVKKAKKKATKRSKKTSKKSKK